MKTKKLLLILSVSVAVFLSPLNLLSQTIDAINFDDGADPPTKVTSESGIDWAADDGSGLGYPNSSGYTGASGNYYFAGGDGADFPNTYEAFTYTFSTLAYGNVTVQWGAYKEAGFANLTLESSIDNGTTWTPVSFTDVSATSTWLQTSVISLPSNTANQSVVTLRWSFTDDGAGAYYLFDDITLAGTVNTYFSKSSGNLDVLGTWGTNFDGTGTSPTSFTVTGITYEIVNNASATIGSNWTVSGSSSKVRVGDLTTTPSINFTIPSTSIFTGTVDVAANGTLTIQNTTLPTLGTLATNTTTPSAAGSTVNYAQSGAITTTSAATKYHNLIISGSGTKTLGGGTTVYGTLNISAGSLAIANNALKTLTLNGPITGSGTITGGAACVLNIGGSGTFGTMNFTGGSNTLRTLQIARSSSTITLGSNLSVTTIFKLDGNSSTILDLNGQTLTLNAASTFTNSTEVRGSSTSNISFSGTFSGSFMMDQTSSSTKSLSNLTFNKSGATLTLGNALNIIDSICPKLGTINTGGNLTLIADLTTVGHTGRIGIVGGAISGNVISQVYHKPNTNNTDWRLLGVAGVSGAGFSQWNAVSTGGSGVIPMSCPTCPYTSVGGQAFSSITSYDETGASNGGYPDITYGSNIQPGSGYWVYMGNSSPTTTSSPFLVSVTGTPVTGSVTVSGLTNSNTDASLKGYNLVANPYASPISFTKLQAANPNIDGTWYTYSPVVGTNAYYQISGSLSSPAYSHGGDGIDDVIPAGMGFYIHLNSGSSITFAESMKVTGSNETLLRETNPNGVQSNITFFRMNVSGTAHLSDGYTHNMTNEAIVRFDAGATTGYDGDYDAYFNPSATYGWLQISTSSLGKKYTINGQPDLTQNVSLPLTITCGKTGTYQFVASDLQNMPTGACIKLHDNYTNNDYDLRSGSLNLTIHDTETVARFTLNITVTPLNITTNVVQTACPNDSNGYIIAVGNDAGPWNYTWKDGSGNIVKTSLNKTTADSLNQLNNGIYTVDVSETGMCTDAIHTFTLTAPNAPLATFNTAPQVNVGDNVVLTNTSNNADAYIWNFGNGDISSLQTPSYVYNNAGTYTITLDAINAACQDTSVYTQVIQVDAASSGISKLNSGSGNIFVSQDASGNFIQFDYSTQTKVNIVVYNTLGQILLNNAVMSVTNDKIYLNIGDVRNQAVYITITDIGNNKQTTKKLINY